MAAERKFDFSDTLESSTPSGFRSAVMGSGPPGEWKVILEEVPPLLPPLTAQAQVTTRKAVLAQLSKNSADEHFPMFILEDESFGDFTFSTRFKTVSGTVEQMAGLAFRIQDETNYYVVRASSLGNTFRFYKVVNGIRGNLIGPEVPVPSGAWHEMSVQCTGNQIRCSLDGKELIPSITDNTFMSGKIGFWTKSDSISYFSDAKISYTPREPPAQTLVRDMLKKYTKLIGLSIYVCDGDRQRARLIASKNEKDIGQTGQDAELAVIRSGSTYYGKLKGSVIVTMPLRDRNGETIAATKLEMKSFLGQTENNAVARALPIVKDMQVRVQSMQDLVQ